MMRKNEIIATALAFVAAATLAACNTDKPDALAPHRDADAAPKKGVCVSRYNDGGDDSNSKIDDLGCGWYYNWGTTGSDGIDAEYVPMVWGAGQANDGALISRLKTEYESGKIKYVLTFNEPDLRDQSNMSVDVALSYWDELESIGAPLSSPAVSYYGKTDGNAWLDEFMQKAAAQGKRVDFIAIHMYQSFYSAGVVNELRETLNVLYEKYGLPVWLTEFGAIDIIERDRHSGAVSPNCTAKNAQSYITQATNMLEQCGFVERYAWFVDNFNERGDARPWEAPHTTLYTDADALSAPGRTYKAIKSNTPLYIETSALDGARNGNKYSQTVTAAGGTGDYSFTASGLPAGLTVSKNGTIVGTPKTVGTFDVKITVTDSADAARRQTLTKTLTLKVEP